MTQHAVRAARPVRAYQKWMRRIPRVYRTAILGEEAPSIGSTEADDECLATLKHYRSLLAMAQEARKPAFFLRAADGAIGGHLRAVRTVTKTLGRWRPPSPNGVTWIGRAGPFCGSRAKGTK